MNVYEKVREIFCDIFDDKETEFTSETSMESYDEWDSLVQLQLIVAVEHKFDVEFTTTEIKTLNSLGDFVKLIEEKKA